MRQKLELCLLDEGYDPAHARNIEQSDISEILQKKVLRSYLIDGPKEHLSGALVVDAPVTVRATNGEWYMRRHHNTGEVRFPSIELIRPMQGDIQVFSPDAINTQYRTIFSREMGEKEKIIVEKDRILIKNPAGRTTGKIGLEFSDCLEGKLFYVPRMEKEESLPHFWKYLFDLLDAEVKRTRVPGCVVSYKGEIGNMYFEAQTTDLSYSHEFAVQIRRPITQLQFSALAHGNVLPCGCDKVRLNGKPYATLLHFYAPSTSGAGERIVKFLCELLKRQNPLAK